MQSNPAQCFLCINDAAAAAALSSLTPLSVSCVRLNHPPPCSMCFVCVCVCVSVYVCMCVLVPFNFLFLTHANAPNTRDAVRMRDKMLLSHPHVFSQLTRCPLSFHLFFLYVSLSLSCDDVVMLVNCKEKEKEREKREKTCHIVCVNWREILVLIVFHV